jgi:hypothetical protein
VGLPIGILDPHIYAFVLPESMKGILFNLLEEVVVSNYGEDIWDQLLTATALEGAYTSLGSYPDEQIQELVGAASRMLGRTSFEVLRWFGRQAIPLLFVRYPGFFRSQPSTRPFVLSVNNIIHPEVRKVYPGADVPTFEFRDDLNGGFMMGSLTPAIVCTGSGVYRGRGNALRWDGDLRASGVYAQRR